MAKLILPTWFWEEYYISFLYRPSKKYTTYAIEFAVLRAKNKRHARKVLFKFLPKKYKNHICKIKIEQFKYIPSDLIAEAFDGPNHFWENQMLLG